MVGYREDTYRDHGAGVGTWTMISRDKPTRATALLLLIVIAVFVLVDVVLRLQYRDDGSVSPLVHLLYMNLTIGRDNTISENFNHGVAFAAALMFFVTAVAARSRICFALAGFMALAWWDDSAQYHERFGRIFGERFPDIGAFGVGAIHIGELVAWASIGIVLLLLILWASRRVLPGDKVVLRLVVPPILLLGICAVVVDVIHVPFAGTDLDAPFMYLEDGGEMIAIALIATVALYLVRNTEAVYGRV